MLGDGGGIGVARDDVGGDEHQELGAVLAQRLVTKQHAEPRHVLEVGDAGVGGGAVLGNEAADDHGLAVAQAQLGRDVAVLDQGAGDAGGGVGQRRADLLADRQVDAVAGMDDRPHRQQHAGLAVVDRLQDAGGAGVLDDVCRALTGDDRHLGADLDPRLAAAFGEDARRRQHAEALVLGEGVEESPDFADAVEDRVVEAGGAERQPAGAKYTRAGADTLRQATADMVHRGPVDAEIVGVVERQLGDGHLDQRLARRPVECF